MHLQITSFIESIGLIGIFAFVFAESGLFFGFFLPGDSLLFTAGFLASAGYFNLTLLFLGSFICAVLGDSVGYWFGKKTGPKIFSRPNSLLWNKNNIEKAQSFYKKYGTKTITLARFVPVVRTFAPILAGVGDMDYYVFLMWNILGAFGWTMLMILTGYFLGHSIKDIDKIILPIVLVIIFLSFLPVAYELLRKKKEVK